MPNPPGQPEKSRSGRVSGGRGPAVSPRGPVAPRHDLLVNTTPPTRPPPGSTWPCRPTTSSSTRSGPRPASPPA